MLDSLIHIARFAHYKTIAAITQVSRELRDARLWRLAMRQQYPHSVMNEEGRHHRDYLRYLIARTGDNIMLDESTDTMFEMTKQMNELQLDFIPIYPKYTGKYIMTKNGYKVVKSGGSKSIVAKIKKMGDKINKNNYVIWNMKVLNYSFKNITITHNSLHRWYDPPSFMKKFSK